MTWLGLHVPNVASRVRARPLVIDVVADIEVLGEARAAADAPPVRRGLRAQRGIPAVIAVPVRQHEVVNRRARRASVAGPRQGAQDPFHVPAHPLAAKTLRSRSTRHMAKVLRPVEVPAIKQHRRAVGKDEERLLAASRLDEVDVQLARLPHHRTRTPQVLFPTHNLISRCTPILLSPAPLRPCARFNYCFQIQACDGNSASSTEEQSAW